MCDHLGTGPNAMYSLATAVAYRAMAEAGLQKPADADWYAHVALALYPKLAQQDWSAYGDAGEWLTSKKHEGEPAAEADAPIRLPIKKEDPECPLSAIVGAYYQPVTVEAVGDADRRVHSSHPPSPTDRTALISRA